MLIKTNDRLVNLDGIETIIYRPGWSADQLVMSRKAVGQVRHVQKLQEPQAGEAFKAILEVAAEEDSFLLLWQDDDGKTVVVNALAASAIAYVNGDLRISLTGMQISKSGSEAKAMWEKLLAARERSNSHV